MTKTALSTAVAALVCLACRAPSPGPPVPGGGQLLDRFIRDSLPAPFSGQIVLSRGGELLLNGAYGVADSAAGTPVTPGTAFDVGSLTKQFTAAAVLRLQEEGALTVLDTLGRFLTGLPVGHRELTLHELLTHTASLPRYSGGDYDPVTRDSLVAWLSSLDRPDPSPRGFSYSNPGYSVLAAVIEVASGVGYERYLSEELLEPAGLERTGYVLPGWTGPLATGYRDGERFGTPTDSSWAADGPWWNLRGNGGLLSTAGELHRWHRALTTSRVLRPGTAERLFAPYVRVSRDPERWYGYGWYVRRTPRGTVVDHTGGNGVFFAMVRWWRDDDVRLVITNSDFSVENVRALLGRVDRLLAEGLGPERPYTAATDPPSTR